MADREKVIKGLKICTSRPCYCTDCPYKKECCLEPTSQNVMEDALALLKEQEERIAIMLESMEAMEIRLAAVECQPIAVKSTDQMVYVGWMHEDQKLGLSEEEEYAEKNL